MITIEIWQEFVIYKIKNPSYEGEVNMWDIFVAIFCTLIVLPLDIILSPIELITIIIYKFINK